MTDFDSRSAPPDMPVTDVVDDPLFTDVTDEEIGRAHV